MTGQKIKDTAYKQDTHVHDYKRNNIFKIYYLFNRKSLVDTGLLH